MQPIDAPTSRCRWFTCNPCASKNLRRANHVRIIVVGKFGPQAVARFRGFSEAGAELIGKNQIIFRRIEQLAGAKEHSRKRRNKPHAAGAIRAVQNQHGVGDAAAGVAVRRADRRVMQPHLRKRLAVRKFEIVRDEIAFLGRHSRQRRILLRRNASRRGTQCRHPHNRLPDS